MPSALLIACICCGVLVALVETVAAFRGRPVLGRQVPPPPGKRPWHHWPNNRPMHIAFALMNLGYAVGAYHGISHATWAFMAYPFLFLAGLVWMFIGAATSDARSSRPS